jgi:hypothetical protein
MLASKGGNGPHLALLSLFSAKLRHQVGLSVSTSLRRFRSLLTGPEVNLIGEFSMRGKRDVSTLLHIRITWENMKHLMSISYPKPFKSYCLCGYGVEN